jgi:hypothetical protein
MIILNMSYTKSEIKELSLKQFSESQLKRALEAFNGIAQLFGKDFIDKKFKGYRCPSEVIYITELWENWKIIEPCKNSIKIIKRWKEGLYEEGISAELFIFAHLIKSGIVPELFPCIENKEPDCRINLNNQIIFIEITHRNRSENFKKGIEITGKVARLAGKTFKGSHAKIAILRLPTNNDFKIITHWLQNIGAINEGKLGNLAYFYLDTIESPLNKKDRLNKYIPPHSYYATFLEKGIKGTAGLYIDDIVAKEILEREAQQLPKQYPGIICIDTSSVSCGYENWIPLIKRRFQPKINKRISAVLLFSISLSNKKSLISGCFLNNIYAKYYVNDGIKIIFENIFNT